MPPPLWPPPLDVPVCVVDCVPLPDPEPGITRMVWLFPVLLAPALFVAVQVMTTWSSCWPEGSVKVSCAPLFGGRG